jgi:ribonuclease P protein component
MLPKNNRADKKAVEKIFKKGAFVNSNSLSLKYILENNTTSPRISFIVPKAVEKRAVKRNSLRRRGYIILKKYFSKIPNRFLGVFIFNKIKPARNASSTADAGGEKEFLSEIIEKDIKIILTKLKFIKRD